MATPTASTEIINLSLDIIKTQNIQDVEIPDGDKIAEMCARWWDVSRQAALEGLPWVFASKRAELALSATAPITGYANAYALPNDYISLNWLMNEEIPKSQYQYTIEDGKILLNNSGEEKLYIGYVYDNTEVGSWSAAFKIYMAHHLATKIVFGLTGNLTIAKAVRALLDNARLEAKAINGLNDPPKAYRASRILRAGGKYHTTSEKYIR